MNSANRSPPDRSQPTRPLRKWFPSSTLAELLLLCILVCLVLATWLQAKRDLEGPRESLLLTMHENLPRAAIYSRAGLRVIDCATGKTLLKLPPFPHYAQSAAENSPWHSWPGSNVAFTWPSELKSAQVFGAGGIRIITNLDEDTYEDYTSDLFQREKTEATTVTIPDDGYGRIGAVRSLRFAFSQSGNALVVRFRVPDGKFEYQIFDFRTGKKTAYQNAAGYSGLATAMVTQGDLVAFGNEKRQVDKLIDPAVGKVDPAAFPNIRAALEPSWYNARFPMHGTDEQGRKLLLTLLPNEGILLVVEPDIEGKQFTDLKSAKVLWKWEIEPNRAWQSQDRLVLWSARESQPQTESNVWIVESKSPFVRRTQWPFGKNEIVDAMTMEVNLRGMTAQRAIQSESASGPQRSRIYWDFENARVAAIPEDARQTRRYGDLIVAQTDEQLQTIDLNSGKVVRTISLKHGFRPPLGIVWTIWLAAWWFVKRKPDVRDATRQVGAATAIFYGFLIFQTYYYANQRAWLLALLLIAALLIALLVVAISRKASLISLTVCGLLMLGLLFSGIQHACGNYPEDTFGPLSSPATTLVDELTATPLGSRQEMIDSLLAPWTTPQKTPLPAPLVTVDPN